MFQNHDLISDALPFGRLWYGGPNAITNAVDYAKFRSRSHRAVIRVYDRPFASRSRGVSLLLPRGYLRE